MAKSFRRERDKTAKASISTSSPTKVSIPAKSVSALLSVLCYAEFGVEIPVTRGSFSYLRVELGDFIAFIAAANILLEAIVGAAGLGRSWSSYLASLVENDSDYFRIKVDSFAKGFDLLDPVVVAVLLVANGIAMSGTKRTSWLNFITSIVTVCVIVFIVIVGFDMVSNMAEETEKPSRDIPIGLVGSMSMIIVVYCLMALALTMMVKYTEIDVNAAYFVAFTQIGMKWAKYLVGICALKGMTTSLHVGSLGQAWYTTQIARSHMIHPWFALVHPKQKPLSMLLPSEYQRFGTQALEVG
ncbi:PREDICTED: cationic amino acid transporter 8, vacuolar-like [Camelina sativa]|uniref:Cationic amino acid transporter 8, vacuolar-like n=1 Tax=Camelina sativa TaxID=90675 RepID=A0ABM0WQ38_CAMSA|nr:PREDICTED: cationic amino acid transporter 8, vacuolar-like [Camelina sativa]